MLTRRGFLSATTATLCVPAAAREVVTAPAAVSHLCGSFKLIIPRPVVQTSPHVLRLQVRWARIESAEIAEAWTRMLAASDLAAPTVRCVISDIIWKRHRAALDSRGPITCSGSLESISREAVLYVATITVGQELPPR